MPAFAAHQVRSVALTQRFLLRVILFAIAGTIFNYAVIIPQRTPFSTMASLALSLTILVAQIVAIIRMINSLG